ncbi:Rv0909 family putative TA system antitoxin [uncultured Jatrophihabitans sp.]|uniref:Rv0909 family putative TA system antitoxin n=1 Tax=uncultured Jatrophihabitans sp. TaxID=1610747 RepID=UPI0035C9C51A
MRRRCGYLLAVRFVTFNISSGRSLADGRVDVDRFAAVIAALDADVLSLQEVDRDQQRSGGADLCRIAAKAMGARHHVFAPTLYGTPGSRWTAAGDRPQRGPAYGCALLSQLPLRKVQVLRTPAAPIALPLWVPKAGILVVREEPRVAIVAQIDLGDGHEVTVVGTHLPFAPVWKSRQLRRLVQEVRARPDPLLLLGDLNLRGAAPARITGFRSLASAPTFPAPRPRLQLDHILARGEFGSVASTSTPLVAVSDHRPLVVDLDLLEAVRSGGRPGIRPVGRTTGVDPRAEEDSMPGLDDIKKLADEHDDQVDKGLDKAGDAAGAKFGHEDQIDKAVDAAEERTGDKN